MNTEKRIRNVSTNISFAAYGYSTVEGNEYILKHESKESIELASSPNLADVSSFLFSTSPSSSSEPPNVFSELLVQLPTKRGLSKYYKGKSRTFTSLSDVRCVEDLSKREIPHKKRTHNPLHSPNASISKKAGRSCFTSLMSK